MMGRVTYEAMAAHWPTATDDDAGPMEHHSQSRLLADV
jgi:dihydrofolate reductase